MSYSLVFMAWNFGDPGSGVANTSFANNPVHTFSGPGTYSTELVFYYSCGGGTDTLRQVINIQGPAVSINSNSITCANLGSATISAVGGVPPLTYTWLPVSQTGSVATGLIPGNYSVVVSSGGGSCVFTSTASFAPLVPLTGSVSASPSVQCNSAATATSAIINLAGGSATQNYVWSNGLVSYAAASPTNLSAGNWTSTVTDALTGCSFSNTFVITQPPALTLTLNGSNNNACTSATVGLSGLASGGTAPYTYTWSNGPAGANYTPTLLPATFPVFTLTAFDAYNCSINGGILINVIPQPTVSQNYTVLCQGSAFTFSASGGSAYSWSGPPAFSSASAGNTISNIQLNQAGVYTLTVTAANNCTAAASLSLVVNPTPTLNASGSTVCSSQTLNLSANSVAGAIFLWAGPLSFSSALQNPAIVSPSVSQSGAYNVTVTSLDACTNTAMAIATVVNPPNLLVTLSSQSMCAQALSGSPNTIVLNSSGAASYTLSTPLHIYNSNPSGPASPLSLLPPYNPSGPATATLFGSNGVCTVSTTAVFTVVPNPTLTAISPTPFICAGQSFTYTSNGASSYSWSSSNPNNYLYTTGNVAVANPSINSVFSVIGGSLGCNSAIQTSTLTVYPLPVFNIVGNALICPGTSALLSAAGTATAYTWSPNVFLNANNSATVMASPPGGQNYVVIGSLNTCTNTAMVTVSVLPSPVAIITAPKTVFCQNESISLTGNGGTAYTWKGPSNFSASGQNIVVSALSSAFSGNYTLTVSDANNCKASASQAITVNNLPQGYLSAKSLEGCAPFCPDLSFKPANGSAPINNYSWQLNGVSMGGSSIKTCFDSPGEHHITGTISDANNCVNSLSATVRVFPNPVADFSFLPEQPVEELDEVQFQAINSDISQSNWSFGPTVPGSSKNNPTFLFERSGSYPVALVVKNQWQCSDTIVKVVKVLPDFAVYVPNAFTPNADGLNELFIPVFRGNKNFVFSIFDRWGQKLYETSDLAKGWDGSFKGELCKEDNYAWKLSLNADNNTSPSSKMLSGNVLLYR